MKDQQEDRKGSVWLPVKRITREAPFVVQPEKSGGDVGMVEFVYVQKRPVGSEDAAK
jgi:hypothetical protein